MLDRWKKSRQRLMILGLCMLGLGCAAGSLDKAAGLPAGFVTELTREAAGQVEAAGAKSKSADQKKTAKETDTAGKQAADVQQAQQAKAAENETAQDESQKKETAAESNVKPLTDIKRSDITYIIALDPGHGGMDTGADGWNSSEKRLNLLIGKYLKKELEKYDHVKVVMTRSEDVFVGLHNRMKIAKKKHADLLVSLHNDSWDPGTPYDNGSSVLIAKKDKYKPEMAVQELYLARSILSELEKLGLVNRGLVRKKSKKVTTYEDGTTGDYHAIIRDGMIYSIPSILVEHAFCDNRHDYTHFLKTNKQLKALAAADARGIARFLGLRRSETGEVLEPIVVKDKKLYRADDPELYYTLAGKAYYISLYDAMQESGSLRHQTNLDVSAQRTAKTVAGHQSGADQSLSEEELAREAVEKAEAIRLKNKAAEKQMTYVIWMILAGFGLVVLIREFDFGFRFSIRVRRRGERYRDWNHWETGYNFKERKQL